MNLVRILRIAGVACVALMAYVGDAAASQIVYEPVNPSFGGSPFNGSYLLGNAEGQNDNREPEKERDPLEDFSRTVTSSLISRISRDIADSILGEDAQESGTYTIGDTVLNFQRDGDVVRINIIDTVGGKETTVEVPAPTF